MLTLYIICRFEVLSVFIASSVASSELDITFNPRPSQCVDTSLLTTASLIFVLMGQEGHLQEPQSEREAGTPHGQDSYMYRWPDQDR